LAKRFLSKILDLVERWAFLEGNSFFQIISNEKFAPHLPEIA